MKIQLREVTIRELAENYSDDGEGGVKGYKGKLDIRPPYQREFVYGEKERNSVIETIQEGFPLNVMYWADRGNDAFEIIDGQQRTISICQYVHGNFSINGMAFYNLQEDQKNHIFDYVLRVYACSGTDSERLKWFETINIAGKTLTKQELRNAVYHGSWVSDAKGYFSRKNCPAQSLGNKLLQGSANRQEYLETAIKWMNNGNIEKYMSKRQHDKSAVALWNYFRSVIDWVNATFITYRKFMKGVEWGALYNRFKNIDLDPIAIEKETARLILDDDVTNKSGIYPYLLDGDEWNLNIRPFTPAMRQKVYEKQEGICPECGKHFKIEEMDADHIIPWSQGGKTEEDNCQMISRKCNQRKGAK
ncbi:MAG: DUF262 domain-containing protein [Aestuariivita sp.]|nr:DUF262 domain-containing protein [Aestuariivita sp.]